MEKVASNEKIKISRLTAFPKVFQIGPRLLQYLVKTVYLSNILIMQLVRLKTVPRFVLLQNPPSIPTLLFGYIYCKLMGSNLVIDWHNYGYTILQLVNGPNHVLVKICKKMELFFGKLAHFNLCVTEAMKDDLATFNIKAFTLYDKPFEQFKALSIEEKHLFFSCLNLTYGIEDFKDGSNPDNTGFTYNVTENKMPQMKDKRPALIVSSSSWTEDEDFHILIDALDQYENEFERLECDLPKLICLLTGKGPLKQYYENLFNSKKYSHIKVHFVWLDPQDYPLLLGCADLGICLHKSTSRKFHQTLNTCLIFKL
jgi:beta-1,4-mannosyltransferase